MKAGEESDDIHAEIEQKKELIKQLRADADAEIDRIGKDAWEAVGDRKNEVAVYRIIFALLGGYDRGRCGKKFELEIHDDYVLRVGKIQQGEPGLAGLRKIARPDPVPGNRCSACVRYIFLVMGGGHHGRNHGACSFNCDKDSLVFLPSQDHHWRPACCLGFESRSRL